MSEHRITLQEPFDITIATRQPIRTRNTLATPPYRTAPTTTFTGVRCLLASGTVDQALLQFGQKDNVGRIATNTF